MVTAELPAVKHSPQRDALDLAIRQRALWKSDT
jgi:hypothetical protein